MFLSRECDCLCSSVAKRQVRYRLSTDPGSGSVEVIGDFDKSRMSEMVRTSPIPAGSRKNGRRGSGAGAFKELYFLLPQCGPGEGRELDLTWDGDFAREVLGREGGARELSTDVTVGSGLRAWPGAKVEHEGDEGQQEALGSLDSRSGAMELLA